MSTLIHRGESNWESSQYANVPYGPTLTMAANDANAILTLDANPTVYVTDARAIDTCNLMLRTCNEHHIMEAVRLYNKEIRLAGDTYLVAILGKMKASQYQLEDTALQSSFAAIFGRIATDKDLQEVMPRVRNRNGNPRIKTQGDPDFFTRRSRYRTFRRNDTHPDLLDSSWIGSPSRHPSEIQHV